MTLSDDIADVSMFLDVDGFGEKIDIYPSGLAGSVNRNVVAIVDRSHLQGSNEVRGDGVGKLNSDRGRGYRESLVIEVKASQNVPVDGRCIVAVTESGTKTKRNWAVKRSVGNDSGLAAYLAVRTTEQQIRKSERVG